MRRTYLALICVALILALFSVAYPMYVIRPFRPQGVRELALALDVLRFRAPVLLLSLVAAALAMVACWRSQPRLRTRILAALGFTGVLLFAGLSRLNVYELMFRPMGPPRFAPVAGSRLDKDEKVIAVNINGTARAYPIRIISYHHIANDVVGGHPIVATY